MQLSSTLDDRLLASDVETALKALGIAAGEDDRRDGHLRLAVDDLRGVPSQPKRFLGTDVTTPPLLASDSEIFGTR